MKTLHAIDSPPLPVRKDDRIKITGQSMHGIVRSLYRNLKNGRPGVRFTRPAGDRIHGSCYLDEIEAVNGQRTDFRTRYAPTELAPLPSDSVLATMAPIEQVGHILRETHGVEATLKRLPVPDAFDPAEENDAHQGLVGVDVTLRFRMDVPPADLLDVDKIQEAFHQWLATEIQPARWSEN